MTAQTKCWIITGDDGVYGVYTTEALAEQHRALLGAEDEFEIEWSYVLDELDPVVFPGVAS